MNTTRRHPRTLEQAFPQDYCAVITHYRGSLWTRMRPYVCIAAIALCVGMVVFSI